MPKHRFHRPTVLTTVMSAAMLLAPADASGQEAPGPCESSDCCGRTQGAELHGRVLAAEGGGALPGARVEFRVTSPPEGGDSSMLEVEANPSGAYRLCGISPPARVEARAEHSGATSRSVSFLLDAPRPVELSFEIRGVPANLDSLQRAAEASPQSAEPGRVVGRIEDADTGRPVAEATVTLEPSGRQALSDREGRFAIDEAPAGAATLAIHHVAYGDQTVDVDVPSERTLDLDIELPPKAIEVEPVEVRVEATVRDPHLERIGYYERKMWAEKVGIGEFLEAPDLQMRGAELSDVLSTMPGLRSLSGQYDGFVHFARYSNTIHGGPCFPAIYLDGRKIVGSMKTEGIPGTRTPSGNRWNKYEARLGGPWGLTNLVSPAEVAAVEVYKGPASTAGEFQGSDSRCGVIAIWTKFGPGPNGR